MLRRFRAPMSSRHTILRTLSVRWYRSGAGLYMGAFLYALHIGTVVTATPWRVMDLGGGPVAVGLVGGLQMGVYAAALLGAGRLADWAGNRRLARLATLLTALATAGMALAGSIPALLVLVGINAAMPSMFWPPVLGWLSTGQESSGLNRRLGLFNLCWPSALVVGNLCGGALFQAAYWLPFLVASGASLTALGCVSRVRITGGGGGPEPGEDPPATPPRLRIFRAMARAALITGWMGLGALRYPMATFLKSLGRGADVHGAIGGGISLAMLCALWTLGRSPRWHYRLGPFWGAQLVTAGLLAAVALAPGPLVVAALAVPAALCLSIVYASHQYYGLSSGRSRAGSAAVHELVLAGGFVTGAWGGGWVADVLGVRAPFPLAGAAIGTSVLLQLLLYTVWRVRGA